MERIIYDSNWDGKEVWRMIKPDGSEADFCESSQKRAEDYMIAEALTGSMATREEMIDAAQKTGYRIERIK
jgi:hypothetical protein